MPAVSKAQQRFMGMVHATQKGDMEAPSKEVEKAADSMKKSDAKDYASTKHKGLPMHKETITKTRLKELVKEVMVEEAEYQAFFKKALEKAGKSIASMSDDEKKAFFNKVDSAWNGKGEKNEALVGGQKKLDVDKDGDIGGDDLADLRAKNEGLSKDTIIRTLTRDKNAYFLTKDGNGWILDITPKAAQQSTFHQKFDVKDLGKGHLGMKYKLSELTDKQKQIDVDKDGDIEGDDLSDLRAGKKVNEGRYDADLDKIEAAVKGAKSFMNVGAELKKAGIKYDFTTSMIPMYMIKVSGNTIAICNKKYVAGAEREVKDIAIGLLN